MIITTTVNSENYTKQYQGSLDIRKNRIEGKTNNMNISEITPSGMTDKDKKDWKELKQEAIDDAEPKPIFRF